MNRSTRFFFRQRRYKPSLKKQPSVVSRRVRIKATLIANSVMLRHELQQLAFYQGDDPALVKGWEDEIGAVDIIHNAAYDGDADKVEELLSMGESVDKLTCTGPKLMRDPNEPVCYAAFFLGSTPLMMAAFNGHVSTVKLLCNSGADINNTDSLGFSAFSIAAGNCHIDVCRYFLNLGANINCTDQQFGYSPLLLATRKNHGKMATWLVKKNADRKVKDLKGRMCIHFAAWNFNLTLLRLFVSRGIGVNTTDNEGNTPLHYLLGCENLETAFIYEEGREDAVKTKIARGGDCDSQIWTCLLYLLKQGADPNAKSVLGQTPLHVVTSNLQTAEIVNGLVNVTDVKKNQLLLVSMLILTDLGGDMEAENNDKQSPRSLCRASNNELAMRLLPRHRRGTIAELCKHMFPRSHSYWYHYDADVMEGHIKSVARMLVQQGRFLNRRTRLWRRITNASCWPGTTTTK